MSKPNRTRLPQGIERYHQTSCRIRQGGRTCNCQPRYRAKFTGPNGRETGPWFLTLAQAVNWRADQLAAVRSGTYVQPTQLTVRDAAADFIAGARAGRVLNR